MKPLLRKMMLACISLALLPAHILPAQTNWTMGDKDPQRTSWVWEDTDFAPPLTMTTYNYPEPLASTAGFKTYRISYADGIAYLGIGAGPIGNAITAFDYKNNVILWTTTIPGGTGAVGNDPVITPTRVICGGQGNALLIGINRQTGDVVWNRAVGSMYGISATLDDNRLYLCTDSLYSLDPETGDVYWRLPTTRTQGSTPALSGNYLTHIASNRIVVRDKWTGDELWSQPGAAQQGLTVSASQVFVAGDSSVLAFGIADGSTLWRHDVPEQMNIGWLSGNALARDNSTLLYAMWDNGSGKGVVRALDLNDGSVRWTYTAPGEGIVSLTIVNGYVYFVEWHSRELVALRMSDGSEAAHISGARLYTKIVYGDTRLFAAYDFDPLLGGGLAVFTATSTGTHNAPAPARSELTIYPQPVTGLATLRLGFGHTSGADITVTDALGSVVYRTRAEPETTRLQLNTASWEPGFYVVRMHGGGQQIVKNMMVVR